MLTALAMVAFAANSLLCRAALEDGAIDAASFTAIRVASGAAFLLVLLLLPPRRKVAFSLPMALMLFPFWQAAFAWCWSRTLQPGSPTD